MNTTLLELLSDRNVEIPRIQRDYAQGRENKEVESIRVNIVDAIANALSLKRPLNFDFVYGQHEQSESGKKRLIPIDGQQRLTTLFLVHWYLAMRDSKQLKARNALSRFIYSTRVSATDFCRKLIENDVKLPVINGEPGSLSDAIQDEAWFITTWLKDPTVAGMLTMLDALHRDLFHNPGGYDDLVKDRLLTFHIADMEHLSLDENTYVRMNARGKPLTEYEHFKAQFEKHLADNRSLVVADFPRRMDVDWTRALWQYRDSENLIDKAFMALFTFVTEINFYLDKNLYQKESFSDYRQSKRLGYWQDIYRQQSGLDRLVAYLDLIKEWKDTKGLFESMSSPSQYQSDGISVIDEPVDLIRRCIDGEQFGIAEKVKLFLVFEYFRVWKEELHSNDRREIAERSRVLRNLLSRVWINDSYKFSYRVDLRYEDMPQYLQSALTIARSDIPIYKALSDKLSLTAFQKGSVSHEHDKAILIISGKVEPTLVFRVEDDPRFHGSIQVLTDDPGPYGLDELYSTFELLMRVPNQAVVFQALLTLKRTPEDADDPYLFYGIHYERSSIGERWYFGHSRRWLGFLTFVALRNSEVGPAMRRLLAELISRRADTLKKVVNILQQLCKGWLKDNTDFNDWRYYFIRYPEFLNSSNNLFAWKDENDNDFELRSMSSFNARGRHVNAYARALEKLIDLPSIIMHEETRTWGRETSPLVLKGNIHLYCEKAGWRVVAPPRKVTTRTYAALEAHPSEKKQFLLRHTDTDDRIQIARNFIRSLFPEETAGA